MSNENRLEIEELLNNYLKATTKKGDKTFFTSKVTSDFIEVDSECDSNNATQCMMQKSSTSENLYLKSGKIDFINKLDISDDNQFAFFSFTATMLYEKRLFGFKDFTDDIYNMNIFSGYLKKLDGKWRLAWIQQAMKYIEVDEDE